MSSWTRWFWPGVITTVFLTALAIWFRWERIEDDLAFRSQERISLENSWANVELDGRDLILKGMAPSEEAQQAANLLAAGTRGVRTVDDMTTLLPVASPFVFRAIKEGEGITLVGNVPFGPVRVQLLTLIERANPGIRIRDNLTPARGEHDGFVALAGFALSQICDLATGEVSLSGREYSIRGLPVNSETYERLNAGISGALPGGGTLSVVEISRPPTIVHEDKGAEGPVETEVIQ